MAASDFIKANIEEVARFEDSMKVFFSPDNLKFFKTLLKSQNAIIAGGSVSRAIIEPSNVKNWKLSDLDIYVNAKNVLPMKSFFESLTKTFYVQGVDKLYCDSFLHKNRIIKVIRYVLNKTHHIDLMIVRNRRSLEDVVRNFDLSCCKNYYNGDFIFSLDYDNLKKMETSLSPEYVEFYTKKNEFTKNRLFKYASRGFRIDIPKLEDIQFSKPRGYLSLTEEYIRKAIFDIVMETSGFDNEFIHLFPRKTQYLHYSDDGLDYEDFKSEADYIAIGKGDRFRFVVEKIEEYFATLKKHYDEKKPFDYNHYSKSYVYGHIRIPYCSEDRLDYMWDELKSMKDESTLTIKIKDFVVKLSLEERETLKKLL